MAAGFLATLAAGAVEVRSAGSLPADQVNSAAVEAMHEVGIDISEQTPKLLTTDAVQASDVVITMGCGDSCPVFPGKRYLDWELTHPAGVPLDQVRVIRDEIAARVVGLFDELTSPRPGGAATAVRSDPGAAPRYAPPGHADPTRDEHRRVAAVPGRRIPERGGALRRRGDHRHGHQDAASGRGGP